jgi:uncharacterized protein (TIGR03437 family)
MSKATLTVVVLATVFTAVFPAYAADPDALSILTTIQSRHLPFGTILDPIFAGPTSNQIIGYTRCGDSALWTGHYLAAEAFRYATTSAADALTNARAAVAAIQSLVDVTGTDVLARCLVPSSSPYEAGIASEEAANGIFTNAAMGDIWVGNTSRDEYSGVMFGLGVAYDLFNDVTLRASISALVTRLIDFLDNHAWTVVLPDGSISTTFIGRSDQMLSFLEVANHVNPGHFQTTLDVQSALLSITVAAPILVDTASDDSYFKFNLDYINLYNLIRLDNQSLYRDAYSILRSYTGGDQNAYFNMIDRALNNPDTIRDGATLFMLDQWLKRPRRDPTVDDTKLVPVCGGQACTPLAVPLRVPTDFLWQRSPYQLSGGGSGIIEGAGIDYILPYWMARYYGAATYFAVQSAAPGAIASFYGTGLGSVTSLMVQDAQGTQRPATLNYVSAGQINFVIPAATSIGMATFITSAGNATAGVETVSPTLFAAVNGPPGYLILYGTGIRGRSSLANVTASINGVTAQVTYAGPQPQYAGLDQVNILLPSGASASGTISLTVDYQTSNFLQLF